MRVVEPKCEPVVRNESDTKIRTNSDVQIHRRTEYLVIQTHDYEQLYVLEPGGTNQ